MQRLHGTQFNQAKTWAVRGQNAFFESFFHSSLPHISVCLALLCLALAGCFPVLNDTASSGASRFTVSGVVTRDPQNQEPVGTAFIRVISPLESGWTNINFSKNSEIANKAISNQDGTFEFEIQYQYVVEDLPVLYLAASDGNGTYTLIAPIDPTKIEVDADIEIDINIQSTISGVLHCPGGMYPPPTGSYCWEDPNNVSSLEVLPSAIGIAMDNNAYFNDFKPGVNWEKAVGEILMDPDVAQLVSEAFFDDGDFDQVALTDSVVGALPIVSPPTPDDLNIASASSSTTNTGSTGNTGVTDSCGDPPQGFGSAWWQEYSAWCTACGGIPDANTTSCTF